jgi:hypothetical protein
MFESIESQTMEVLSAIIARLPSALGGVLLLLAGWLLARFLRMVITRLIRSLNALLGRQLHGSTLNFVRISAATETLMGFLVFWSTMLVFVTIAVGVVGFSAAAALLDRLVVFMPALVSGGLIVIASYILGSVVRHLVQHTAAASDIARAGLLGQIAQVSFLTIGVVIGLGQIGVDVSFLVILLAIGFAAILSGFALAFGLGARVMVQNLIAVRHLKQLVSPGQMLEVGADRGRILEFSSTGLVLETAEGRKLIPASLCMEQAFSVITRELKDEQL